MLPDREDVDAYLIGPHPFLDYGTDCFRIGHPLGDIGEGIQTKLHVIRHSPLNGLQSASVPGWISGAALMSEPMFSQPSSVRHRVSTVLSILFLALASAGVAHADAAAPPPEGPAPAWLVADLDSGQILAARDPYASHAPASTIKVLLALVALDELPLDAAVTADAADSHAECNCVGIKAGQTYTARELLDAMLLESGNDAANTMAHLLGGREATVDKMNAKAVALGATGTHTDSPSGLDAPGMDMRSTPRDLAVIFRAALANPVFAEITSQPAAGFPGRQLHNQNELMYRYPGVIGGKTGFTDIARKTYVVAAERDGKRLVVSMMYGLVHEGGPSYWDQAASLFDWGFANDGQVSVGSL